MLWISRQVARCRIVDASIYRRLQCVGGGDVRAKGGGGFRLGTAVQLELVDKFCYIGDMIGKGGDILGKGGGSEKASRIKVRCT